MPLRYMQAMEGYEDMIGRRESMKLKPLMLFVSFVLALTMSLGAADVVVKIAPPAPQSVVVIGKAPSPRHVWIGGYWRWHGGRYVWVPGRWLVPPRTGAIWVAPRWISRSGGFVFVAGHWR